jgi:hypothetical protein
VVRSMLELMYDPGDAAFYDLSEPESKKIRVRTPTIFFPLALEEIEQRIAERILDAHFDREDEFATPLPIPSVELRDPAFYPGESQFLWRGPSWASSTGFSTTP